MSKILSIDLGTGFSAMSVWIDGETKIIENAEGRRTTPSIVALTDKGEWLVGQAAKNQAVTNPENTVYEVKRLMGASWDDPKTQADVKRVPYKCKKSSKGGVVIELQGKDYTPEEISAKILSKLKTDAEAYLGETITEAVITVPAYFNDAQRNSTKTAGKIAGMEVKRIINEPTAAALAYGLNKSEGSKNILVYDNGSGTLDVSILEITDGVFEVKSTSGDTHCGGSDIDKILIDYIAEEFIKTSTVDVRKDKLALQRVKEAAENAKIALSSTTETEINLPYISATASGPVHLVMKITRAKLESLIDDFVKKTLKPIDQALKDAEMKKSDINDIVMVGGTTRIPMIQKIVSDYFNGKELDRSINPDEVVSQGAAVEGGILQGNGASDILLLDVTPLTLSIETLGGVATPMIERNTTIPVSKKQTFSTAVDNQSAITVRVAQGERSIFAENKLLGEFNLEGIAPAPRGVPQIEITYDIDANGILNVKAVDLGTKKEMTKTISGSTKLSDEEVDRMVKEAEAHAEADKKFKELIDKKNEGEGLVNYIEKALKDNADKISQEVKDEVEPKLNSLKEVLKKDSVTVEEIQKEIDELQSSAQKIGEAIYKATQEAQTAEEQKPENSESETQNAEFTEK